MPLSVNSEVFFWYNIESGRLGLSWASAYLLLDKVNKIVYKGNNENPSIKRTSSKLQIKSFLFGRLLFSDTGSIAALFANMTDYFTPIHNEVLEALCKINLSPYETRILFAIWRKTYGFFDGHSKKRKKKDWISGSQLTQLTGLDRRHISRTLKSLVNKNVISRDDKEIGFSKKFMKLMSSVEMTKKKKKLSSVEMTPVISRDDKMSSVEAHTKERRETITKEIISKDITKKKTFGNKDVNFLIEYLKEKLQLPMLDGSRKQNGKFCWLALKKFGGVDKVKMLIDVTAQDKFWSTKITSFQQLYYKGVQIISNLRGVSKYADATKI